MTDIKRFFLFFSTSITIFILGLTQLWIPSRDERYEDRARAGAGRGKTTRDSHFLTTFSTHRSYK